MSSRPSNQIPLYRPLGVIAVLLAIMAVIAFARRNGLHDGVQPHATPVRTADLLMQDNQDGSVTVTQAGTGRLVTTWLPKTNAFVRVLLTGLVRERRREGEGSHAIPFHLTRWSDGRLTVDDTATGRLIELEAFGHTNEDAFAELLNLSPPPPTR
jgi:putative photosynthetic complex assembly protein